MKRITVRFWLALSLVAVAGLTALPAAQPAVPAAEECRGTLVLESVHIVSDTDPNPPWTVVDQWTYHVYAWQKDVLARYQDYSLAGDTGYSEQVDLTLQQDVPLGVPGEPVRLKLELWSKEKDPKKGTRGVYPRDRGDIVTTRTETCAAGEHRFSVFVDVLAEPVPSVDEHDGRVEFRWKWTLEVF